MIGTRFFKYPRSSVSQYISTLSVFDISNVRQVTRSYSEAYAPFSREYDLSISTSKIGTDGIMSNRGASFAVTAQVNSFADIGIGNPYWRL